MSENKDLAIAKAGAGLHYDSPRWRQMAASGDWNGTWPVIDRDGELATDPQISAPGLLDAKEDGDLLEECEAEITETIARLKGKAGDEAVREAVRLTLRKFFKRELDKKPVLEVLVSRI